MNIDTLKMFVRVVDQGNISKASEHVNISQSALSQQLKTLEQACGVKLLERTNKGVTPTLFGEAVYQNAKRITDQYDKMLLEIEDIKSKTRSLYIIATNIIYSYALPCTLFHVKNLFPNYSLEMASMASNLIDNKISQGFGDIGFIVGRSNEKNVISKKVLSDKIHLVAGYEMDVPNSMGADDIYKYPLLMLPKSHKTRQILDGYLSNLGINTEKLRVLFDLSSTESIKLSVINGFGLAFLPHMVIKKELYSKQLRIIELQDFDYKYHYYAIKRQNSKYIDSELTKLISYFETIVGETIC